MVGLTWCEEERQLLSTESLAQKEHKQERDRDGSDVVCNRGSDNRQPSYTGCHRYGRSQDAVRHRARSGKEGLAWKVSANDIPSRPYLPR